MAQLLQDKLQELKELESNLNAIVQEAQQSLETSLAQSLQASKQELESSSTQTLKATQAKLQAHIAQTLEQSVQDTQRSIAREIARIKAEFETNYKGELDSTLQAHITRFEKQALQELESSLASTLAQSLLENESLLESLRTHAQNAARQAASEIDYQSLLDYTKIPSEPIAKALAKEPDTQELIAQSAKESTQAHLADPSSALVQTLEKHAKQIYKQALGSDEIIKDRYESKLRLLCLKIFGTQELVESILLESTRLWELSQGKPEKPQGEIKNNIVVVR